MSVFDTIKDVQKTIMSSDLPNKIIATCLAASQSEKKGTYAGTPMLKLDLLTDDKILFSICYRIPKAFTGKGQLDKFLDCMTKLKLKPDEVIGKRFEWQKIKLEGGVSGNDRFYPTKLLGQKAL
jgi:hypothetical protein